MLKGDIGINIYVDIKNVSNVEVFEFEHTIGRELRIENCELGDCKTVNVEGKTYYKLSYRVAAKEMTDIITLKYKITDGQEIELQRYSVRDYALIVL